MGKYGLLIDYDFCTGCRSCEFACRQEHNIPLGQWGIKVLEVGPWKISEDKWQYSYLPMPTDQCTLCGKRIASGKKPSCVQHCQAQVITYGPVEDLSNKLNKKGKQVLIVPH
ncbi:oxidoreductase [Enterocloster clostridioformis]|nr:oxidoreductase [Lachnoclostridium sp. YL32]NDO29443.1 oxidoreductase [Enterocloster clostridioformis]OXE68981.1 oxidoreductase [Enterocloster clostridioformis]QQR02799.1 oxidoreductase [Enterocloster clostridioformis]